MPAELQRIHSIVVDAAEVEIVSDEMRAVVESLWPELVYQAAAETMMRCGKYPGRLERSAVTALSAP
jgi:hypothetical protein